MAFQITTPLIGAQGIAVTSTTKQHALGCIVTAKDSTLGEGEFIYLQGIGSTIVGSIVNYDQDFVTALDTSAVTGPPRAVAIAMSANVASSYGWYQISGNAVAAKASASTFADGAVLSAASGLAIAAATGCIMQCAVVRTVTTSTGAAANYVAVGINRPHDPSDQS